MTVRTYLTILAVLALAYGVGFVLVPNVLGDLYAMQASPTARLMSQFFGVALLAWGLILWFARDFDAATVRSVVLATAIADVAGVIVAAMGVMSGVGNALGWGNVAIFLFGAAGGFYFLTAGAQRTAGP